MTKNWTPSTALTQESTSSRTPRPWLCARHYCRGMAIRDRFLEAVQLRLEPDEQLLAHTVAGVVLPGKSMRIGGSLAATSVRLLFYKKRGITAEAFEVFEYADISSIAAESRPLPGFTVGGGMSMGNIAMVAAGTPYSFQDIPTPGEATALVDVVHRLQRELETPASTGTGPSESPAGEAATETEKYVRMLASLRELADAGVLTEDEFEQKKAEVLRRI